MDKLPVPETPQKRRKALRDLLLAQPAWPERWKWNFELLVEDRGCGTVGCALGLYGAVYDIDMSMASAPDHFAMTIDRACRVFLFHHGLYEDADTPKDVWPVDVADAIKRSPYKRS